MKNMLKKVVSLLAVVAMVASLGSVSVFAAETDIAAAGGTGTSDVLLTTEGATFSVTVPMSLPVSVSAAGVVSVADNTKVINNSHGQVQVKNVTIAGANEWAIIDFEGDMTQEAVGGKKIGFFLNNDKTDADGTLSFTQTNFPVIDGVNEADTDELALTYNAVLPAQRTAIEGANVAEVVFTVGWYEAE